MSIKNTIRVFGHRDAAAERLVSARLWAPEDSKIKTKVVATTNWALLTGLLFVFLAAPLRVHAQCDSTGHGAPGITYINATTSSITVSWLLQCTLFPSRIELRQGGTPQHSWQDGTLLGSTNLPPNGGGVSANNLPPSTTLQHLRLCAVYADSQSWCTPEFNATTSGGGQTPTPTITKWSKTTNSITIWWNGNRSYDFYQTRLEVGNPPQSEPFGGGASGSYPFGPPEFLLQPGTTYEVKVQGCLNGGWQALCSPWATMNVQTDSLPPPPVTAPLNLHTASTSCCEIDVLWTNPPGVVNVPVPSRNPVYTNGEPYKWVSASDFEDLAVIPGQPYTYTVCLNYVNGSACGSITGTSQPGAPPPPVQPQNCQLVFSCPYPNYTPPDYTLTCPGQVDFYDQSFNGTLTYIRTDTKLTGTSSEEGGTIRACVPGTSLCSEYSVYKGQQDWCAPPPPPPPPGGGKKGGCPGGICQ